MLNCEAKIDRVSSELKKDSDYESLVEYKPDISLLALNMNVHAKEEKRKAKKEATANKKGKTGISQEMDSLELPMDNEQHSAGPIARANAQTALPSKVPKKGNDANTRSPKVNNKSSRKRNDRLRLREHYSHYIFLVLKEVHPGLGITKKTMSVMNSFMNDVFERLVSEAIVALKHKNYRIHPGRKSTFLTLTPEAMETATKLVIPGELGKHAVIEAKKALLLYRRAVFEEKLKSNDSRKSKR